MSDLKWYLYMNDPIVGRDFIQAAGSEADMRSEANKFSVDGRMVWLVDPSGQKHYCMFGSVPSLFAKLQTEIDIVMDAIQAKRGPEQQRIASEGLAWVSLLLRKNADYGSSAWKKPVLAPECDVDTAMRVRMSDKIERIQSLLAKDGPEVAEESIRDTIRDLGAYCLLWLACPNEVQP